MTIITFDTEGITYCPMSGRATMRECVKCNYCKGFTDPNCSCLCIFEDVFPEEEE